MNSFVLLSTFGKFEDNGLKYEFRKEGNHFRAVVFRGDKTISSTANVIFYHKRANEQAKVSMDSLPMKARYFPKKNRVEITRDHLQDRLIARTICFAKIEEDPTVAESYYILAETLDKPYSSIILPDQRVMTKESLYLEAIRLKADFSSAMRDLALLYQDRKAEIKLPDGRVVTVWDLLDDVIKLDPKDAISITKIADFLNPGELYALPDGRKRTPKELYVYAKDLDATLPGPYFGLEKFVDPRHEFAKLYLLSAGRDLTKKQQTDQRKMKHWWN